MRFSPPRRFTLIALTFELLLGGLGLALCWWFDRWPSELDLRRAHPLLGMHFAFGLLATLPLIAGLHLMERHPVGILRQLRRTVREEVVPLFRGTSAGGLLAISLAAGIGEELLFRGFLQSAIADRWGPVGGLWAGWITASVLFGLCHSLCLAYALLATGIGLVLGGLYLATGSLVAPMTTHAAYDFLALLYLLRAPADRGGAARMKNGGSVVGQLEPP
ncbi:MAG: CPBP family intramembrane glutamic endopeptidase [Pirellulaceae bacterium]